MADAWMIYGANGYTGRLLAELAVERGHTPVLAGRSAAKVGALGRQLELEWRIIDLDDAAALRRGLEDVTVVLHAAGPFSATSKPMVDACLATGTHYLDITGEIDVFEAVHSRDQEARQAGVTLIPGVGFDVVPTDCLAALLSDRLPDATHLELAICALGSTSAGTTKSMIEGLPKGGRARIDGEIRTVGALWKTRAIPFRDKERMAVTIAWGDVSTAYYSTRIPNICTYMAMPPAMYKWIRRVDRARLLIGLKPVQRLLKALVNWRVDGPTAEERRRDKAEIWGEVRNDDEDVVTGTMTTPEGYELTADASLGSVQRLLAGGVPAGALTPSMAFGSDFAQSLDGVVVHIDEPA